jgi:hypothetical protein
MAAIMCSLAHAHPRHHHSRHHYSRSESAGVTNVTGDPAPGNTNWCGWYMRQKFRVMDKAYNRASYWIHYGSRAAGPAIGVIVVWAHHVGVIVGKTAEGWIVESGNDGDAVRRRVRSLAGAIAFRHSGQSMLTGNYPEASHDAAAILTR